jgi:hypothetical protein
LNTNAAAYWIIPLSRMMTANYAPDATKAISSDAALWMRATSSLFGYAEGRDVASAITDEVGGLIASQDRFGADVANILPLAAPVRIKRTGFVDQPPARVSRNLDQIDYDRGNHPKNVFNSKACSRVTLSRPETCCIATELP